MQAIYHLSSSQEITFDLLESIRNTFKSKSITIFVDEEIEETAHLMSSKNNKKMLEKSMLQFENGNLNWNDFDMIFPVNDLYTNNI